MDSLNSLIIALVSIVLASGGQLLLKYGINNSGTAGVSAVTYFWNVILNFHVISGLLLYMLSVVFWLLALRQAQLSMLYPVVSLSYILVAAGSALFLGESLPIARIIGVAVIISGVVLVAGS